jgi:aspartyl/glutamyl-tRNA(Asn/Gln) amidotransferase, C subunit
MTLLDCSDVLHVANLARLNINEKEIEKYRKDLGLILAEIDKISEANIDEDTKIMISPSTNKNEYYKNEENHMIDRKDAFKNVNKISGDYVVVPKVLND